MGMRVAVHGHPISTWTRTVCMTCVEKGVDYALLPIAYGSPAHRAMHPFGRIPILVVGETTIVETLAIVMHLDEAFAGPALQADDQAARTRMRTWMGVCADYLYRDVVRAIPRDRTPSSEELATARLALERADQLVDGDAFLAGDLVTLADLYLAPQVANCEEKAPALLEGLDGLNAWARRIGERDSFVRTRRD